MYERILVPTDGSEQAQKGVDHAVALAADIGAELHALFVVEEGGNPWMAEPLEEQREQAADYGQKFLDEIVEQGHEAGAEVVTAIEMGPKVAVEINEYADKADMDLIVIGSGYRGSMGGVIGSTAEKVMRSAPVPVTLIRHGGF